MFLKSAEHHFLLDREMVWGYLRWRLHQIDFKLCSLLTLGYQYVDRVGRKECVFCSECNQRSVFSDNIMPTVTELHSPCKVLWFNWTLWSNLQCGGRCSETKGVWCPLSWISVALRGSPYAIEKYEEKLDHRASHFDGIIHSHCFGSE